jgi:ribonuclease PH
MGHQHEVKLNTRIIRADGRRHDELRNIAIERGMNAYAEGSVLIKWGDTVIHCTASVENEVPAFLRGSGTGWVTAEYSMLPRATQERNQRDRKGNIKGRTYEIQRVIGRSMRGAVYLGSLGERTVHLDCDVLQAAGGTRTASITAAFICLVDALRMIADTDKLGNLPLAAQVAAVGVGLVSGHKLLDLSYDEDTMAEVDCSVVMTSAGEFVEIQGTGEKRSFSRNDLGQMVKLADVGLKRLFAIQREVLNLSSDEASLFDHLAEGE